MLSSNLQIALQAQQQEDTTSSYVNQDSDFMSESTSTANESLKTGWNRLPDPASAVNSTTLLGFKISIQQLAVSGLLMGFL